MHWFEGEISTAIQKAISEKKIFIVFVKDDGEQSEKIDSLWQLDEVKDVCKDDLCVAINLTLGTVECEQFGKIYPIICVPAVFFINNDGIPSAIFPYMEKEEFVEKLKNVFQTFQEEKATKSQVSASAPEVIKKDDADEVVNDADTSTTEVTSTEEIEQSTVEATTELTEENESDESKKAKAEALLEKMRASKAEKEKEEAKEKERKRRDEGRELSQAKRDQAERQAKQLADELAKRRAEEKEARERVRRQIQQDRVEKEARYEAERVAREKEKQEKTTAKKVEKEAAVQAAKKEKADSKITRLQFRLPDGSTASKEFNSDAKFLLVQDHATKVLAPHLPCVRLTTVFPKHEYTSEDFQKSLRHLGLTPSASVIVSPGKSSVSSSSSSLNPLNLIMTILAPLIAIIAWFFSLFSSTPRASSNEAPSTESDTTPTQEAAAANENNKQTRDAALRRRNIGTTGSNIRRLYDDKPDDEDNATWNGNSTQQM